MVKPKSIERIFSQYKNRSINDISRIQAAFFAKNPQLIKTILNKPTMLDSSAMGAGRIANQYINHISNQDKPTQKYFDKKLGFKMSSDYNMNLLLLDNDKANRRLFNNIIVKGNVILDKITNINNSSDFRTYYNQIHSLSQLNVVSSIKILISYDIGDGTEHWASTVFLTPSMSEAELYSWILRLIRKIESGISDQPSGVINNVYVQYEYN